MSQENLALVRSINQGAKRRGCGENDGLGDAADDEDQPRPVRGLDVPRP
jgi:hypothetical protein